MTQKKSEKNPQKKEKNAPKIPGIPPDAKVKIIEITPKTFLGPIIFIFLAWALYSTWMNRAEVRKEYNDTIALNQMVSQYQSGAYEKVILAGNEIEANKPVIEKVVDNKTVKVQEIDRIKMPYGSNVVDLHLFDSNNPTPVHVKDVSFSEALYSTIPGIIGTILMVFLFLWFLSRMSAGAGGMGGPMAFIRSRARVYDPENDEKITFADVAGSEEEKSDLEEIVDFLRNPGKYKNLGAKIPRGILLQGPPGTGKTLLARAVAGESNVPFFSISGSEFVEMFVGVGASRVRDLFKDARERAPSIIFIDEIDAIGKKRSPGMGGGHDEREQTLNQILTEMDGFDNETNVIVMAATNRADVLDKALLRPGRFDRKVTINLPTLEDRKKILEVHAKNKPIDS